MSGVDVAIVGAPMDDLVSDRPGTCFAPRAIRAASCPPGPHLEAGVDAFAELRVVDFGDAAVMPAVSNIDPSALASASWAIPVRPSTGRTRIRCRRGSGSSRRTSSVSSAFGSRSSWRRPAWPRGGTPCRSTVRAAAAR